MSDTTVRIEANLTLWNKTVIFDYTGSKEQGYMGRVSFLTKVCLGDVLRNVWTNTLGYDIDSFPLGKNFNLEIKKITALLKETHPEDGENSEDEESLILFSILMGSLRITVCFINNKTKNQKGEVFIVEPVQAISVDSLPGIDVKLPNPISIGFKTYIATNDLTTSLLASTQQSFKRGFTIYSAINIPDIIEQEVSYTLRFSKNRPQQFFQTATESPLLGDSTNDAVPSPIKWKKVDKKLGKVATIHRIGVHYENKAIALYLDVDANASVLQIALISLKLELKLSALSKFKNFGSANNKFEIIKKVFKEDISLGLDGLGIGLETEALTIAGLLKQEQLTIKGHVYEQYIGELLIKTSAFSAIAAGAYGKINGYQSFFMYLYLGIPIGGPPFFNVDGLALGFGYNRAVIAPSIEAVGDFPLIRIVMKNPAQKKGATNIMTDMIPLFMETFPPKKDALFFAIGVKFDSFKLLTGFVLLLIDTSKKLRIDLLGLISLVQPKKHPVIVLEVAFKASYSVDEGDLKIEGRITKNAYLFDKNAKLSGGFAFYAWLKDQAKDKAKDKDQAKAGDFVLTIGGYHPRFKKPSYYPSVPRFGLNWRLTRSITIKATAYFALVPSAIMAGLDLSATYHSGRIEAWFGIGADFLIQWAPFCYDISAKVGVGVKYKTRWHTFTAGLGVKLHIWGPKFSGKLKVRVIFVAFTIKFGATGQSAPLKISWLEFKSEFLPPAQDVITYQILDGLIKEEGEDTYIVNPKDCKIVVETEIPIGTVEVYPVRGEPYTSSFKINKKTIGGDGEEKTISVFNCKSEHKNLPTALWGNGGGINGDRTIPKLARITLTALKSQKSEHCETISIIHPNDTHCICFTWNRAFDKSKECELTNVFGLFDETYEVCYDENVNNLKTDFALRAVPSSVNDNDIDPISSPST